LGSDFQNVLSSPAAAYAEGLRYFSGKGMLNDALSKLAADLRKNGIDYAVIGAVALNQHGYQRFTSDIDILLTREGLDTFREKLVGLGYRPAFEGATKKFRSTGENVPVEIIVEGEYPGDGFPKPIRFPSPTEASVDIDGIQTIDLKTLVELKLCSGMTAPDRLKDLADVQELIKARELKADFAASLDEYVRDKYMELWQAVDNARGRVDY